MNKFEQEQNKIRKKIWSYIPGKGTVIDVGIGENATSAKTFVDKGAYVIAVDNNIDALQKHTDINATLVCCDVAAMPFKSLTADVTLFYYMLHEVNPEFHVYILSQTADISFSAAIVEPGLGDTPGQKYYQHLWQNAMESVGKFEHYQPLEYWEGLVKTAGFTEVVSQRIPHHTYVPLEVKEDMVNFTIEWFKDEGVPDTYIEEASNLMDYFPEDMILPDTQVIVGKSNK
ncbi:MAG: class I SAM-dependent methyltransferase [Candidatus Methanofastidiosia archaeon]|jgi:hypothetical protein